MGVNFWRICLFGTRFFDLGTRIFGDRFLENQFWRLDFRTRFLGDRFWEVRFFGNRLLETRFMRTRFLKTRLLSTRFQDSVFRESISGGANFQDSIFGGSSLGGSILQDSIFHHTCVTVLPHRLKMCRSPLTKGVPLAMFDPIISNSFAVRYYGISGTNFPDAHYYVPI